MKKIIIKIATILSIGIIANGMEQKEIGLTEMLLQPASLEFQEAWHAAQQGIPEENLPKEIWTLINKIKTIQACTQCSINEKKFFINLLNNPDITDNEIKILFPGLIKKHLEYRKFKNKTQLINAILIYASESRVYPSATKPNTLLAKIAIEAGADIDANHGKRERNALSLVAENGFEPIVKLLLNAGANVNISNQFGYTPLMWASFGCHEKIVEMLLDKGADVNPTNREGETALTLALKRRCNRIADILRRAEAT